jgi:hypothetical protein
MALYQQPTHHYGPQLPVLEELSLQQPSYYDTP